MWDKAIKGAAILASLMTAQPGLAQAGNALTSKIELEKPAASPGGPKIYTAPDSVVPGDRVRITLTFANNGRAPAANVNIVNPVPEGLAFDGTDDQTDFTASVDGGKSFASLEMLTVTPEGASPRAATPADVTHVRWLWTSAVPAGQSRSVAFFGKVK